MRIAGAAIVGLAALASTGSSAQRDLPPVVARAVAENAATCSGKVTYLDGFASRRDVNGDGVPDFVFDYGRMDCDGSTQSFCGTGGCAAQIFASMRGGGYKLAFDSTVRSLQFTTRSGRPALILDLHGSACNKVGAAPCPKVLIWNGSAFRPTR